MPIKYVGIMVPESELAVTKLCWCCEREKPLSEFMKDPGLKFSKFTAPRELSTCAKCREERNTPAKRLANRNRYANDPAYREAKLACDRARLNDPDYMAGLKRYQQGEYYDPVRAKSAERQRERRTRSKVVRSLKALREVNAHRLEAFRLLQKKEPRLSGAAISLSANDSREDLEGALLPE